MKSLRLGVFVLAGSVGHASLAFAQPTRPADLRIDSSAIRAGQVVAVQGTASETVTPGNLAAQLAAGAIFVEQRRAAPERAALPDAIARADARTGLKLGFQLTLPPAGPGRPIKVDAWAIDRTGLMLDGARSAYAGTFAIALVDALNPGATTKLARPVAVAITAKGATSVDPRPLRIASLQEWHDVSLVVAGVPGASYPVAISADPNSAGQTIDLSVAHPRIQLLSRPSSFVGWGIGQGTVDVIASGMSAPEGFRVALHATRGTLDSSLVSLDATGHGSTRLRSSADAESVVTVRTEGVLSEPLAVTFDPPWLFLGAAIAGGLAGAFLRGRGRAHWRKALAIGAVSAVVMTLAYTLGIDWLSGVVDTAGLARSGEALVFLLGAIAALVGVTALVPRDGAPRQPLAQV
jgi:hypothetical protein